MKYLLPGTNSLNEFSDTILLVILLVVAFSSIFYIISGLKQLKLIFRNRDNSFTQNGFILFKIVSMIFLGYVIYKIVNIILIIS
jgi:hypothetical protein